MRGGHPAHGETAGGREREGLPGKAERTVAMVGWVLMGSGGTLQLELCLSVTDGPCHEAGLGTGGKRRPSHALTCPRTGLFYRGGASQYVAGCPGTIQRREVQCSIVWPK